MTWHQTGSILSFTPGDRRTAATERAVITGYGVTITETTGFLAPTNHSTPDLKVWCPKCCIWHTHGALPAERARGIAFRGPHCYVWAWRRRVALEIHISPTPYAEARRGIREATAPQRRIILRGGTTPGIERLRAQAVPTTPTGSPA